MGDRDAMIDFACESCGVRGRVAESMVGRRVRCNQCKHVFVVPRPGESFPDAYEMTDPAVGSPATPAPSPVVGASTFAPTYRDTSGAPGRRLPLASKRRKRKGKGRASADRSWPPGWMVRRFSTSEGAYSPVRALPWVAGAGLVGGLIAAVTFAVPSLAGVGGSLLALIGFVLVGVGYGVGAVAAFSEDSLYGYLYLGLPIYTGYYLITRLDDLWPWFLCSTIGFALFLAGMRALQLSGAA